MLSGPWSELNLMLRPTARQWVDCFRGTSRYELDCELLGQIRLRIELKDAHRTRSEPEHSDFHPKMTLNTPVLALPPCAMTNFTRSPTAQT